MNHWNRHTDVQHALDEALRDLNGIYPNVKRVRYDVLNCLTVYSFNVFATVLRVENQEKHLLVLQGNLPVTCEFKDVVFPINLFIPHDYPHKPPDVLLVQTIEFTLAVNHPFIDHKTGVVLPNKLPYLRDWDPVHHSIIDLIGELVEDLAQIPPTGPKAISSTPRHSTSSFSPTLQLSSFPVPKPPIHADQGLTRPQYSKFHVPKPPIKQRSQDDRQTSSYPVNHPGDYLPIPGSYRNLSQRIVTQHHLEQQVPVPRPPLKTTSSDIHLRNLLTEKLKLRFQDLTKEIEESLAKGESLQENGTKISNSIHGLIPLEQSLKAQLKEIRSRTQSLHVRTSQIQEMKQQDIGSLIQPADSASKALFSYVPKFLALYDVKSELALEFEKGRFDLKSYLKQVRELSRIQFKLIAKSVKIHEAQLTPKSGTLLEPMMNLGRRS